jgi:hypothetical protein
MPQMSRDMLRLIRRSPATRRLSSCTSTIVAVRLCLTRPVASENGTALPAEQSRSPFGDRQQYDYQDFSVIHVVDVRSYL